MWWECLYSVFQVKAISLRLFNTTMSHANTLSILLVLATVVVGIQGTPNLDPCLDDRSPQSCYGVICFHGNCHSAFAIKDGHIVLVGRCTCINGWHGEQCDICDHESSTQVDNITLISDGDTSITSKLPQPAYTTELDLVTTTPVIKYCAGLPVERVIPSTCHGLSCLHGNKWCQNSLWYVCSKSPLNHTHVLFVASCGIKWYVFTCFRFLYVACM